MSICHGNQLEHCCWVEGVRCPHLVENAAGRRWACGLMVELGDWDLVHADPRYLADVRPAWERVEGRLGRPFDCGTYGPIDKMCCYAETPVEVG